MVRSIAAEVLYHCEYIDGAAKMHGECMLDWLCTCNVPVFEGFGVVQS